MTGWRTDGQSYSLPGPGSLSERNKLPVSVSNVGNVYPVSQNQVLSISTESDRPRMVRVANVGSITMIISDSQRPFPFGQRLSSGDTLELLTSSPLYVASPPTVRLLSGTAGMVPTVGYVSVCLAQ